MRRSLADARRWMQHGTALFLAGAALDEPALAAPSALPGWSRKHLVAHVAANADALANLIHWAGTGERTPMYSSPQERAAGIERGSLLPAQLLAAWLCRSADQLEAAMAGLGDRHWQRFVITAQGRTVPASDVPWLRSREVCVHAADLAGELVFADLPADFLAALCDDAVAKRSGGAGPGLTLQATDTAARWDLPGSGPATLVGSLADIAAYLTGRSHHLVAAEGQQPPTLPPWL